MPYGHMALLGSSILRSVRSPRDRDPGRDIRITEVVSDNHDVRVSPYTYLFLASRSGARIIILVNAEHYGRAGANPTVWE